MTTAPGATGTSTVITPIYPDRLPGLLPDFCRRAWASARARDVWEPRLSRVTQAWLAVERESVAAELRDAAILAVSPNDMPKASLWAATHGLALVPLHRVNQRAEYSSDTQDPQPGAPWEYRVAYLRPTVLQQWAEASSVGDDDTIGALLGYPACCRAFFREVWVQQGCRDTTWAMVHAPPNAEAAYLAPDLLPENNILLRWFGVRAVSHLPCSFSCEATWAIGKDLLALGTQLGYGEEMEWLREMLQWPVEWSGLHGIAEIKTPVVKVTARTDLTAGKYVVQWPGTRYPEEGAAGIRFPYRTKAQQRRLTPLTPRRVVHPERNGFTSAGAMLAAHTVLARVVAQALEGGHLARGAVVCDLGAGDGTLLRRLGTILQSDNLYGVEQDPTRVPGDDGVRVVVGNFLTQANLWPGPYDLTLLMPGRLLEVPEEMAERCRLHLCVRSTWVVAYAYGDWLQRFRGLEGLVHQTLPTAEWISPVLSGAGAEALLLRMS